MKRYSDSIMHVPAACCPWEVVNVFVLPSDPNTYLMAKFMTRDTADKFLVTDDGIKALYRINIRQ